MFFLVTPTNDSDNTSMIHVLNEYARILLRNYYYNSKDFQTNHHIFHLA